MTAEIVFSKKSFIIGMIFGTVLLFSFIFTFPDGKLHIVFCNVGQGDAAYIRAPNNQDMLIDGGPDDKVLTCLGKNMPFYDRTLDVVVLSHPQKDHLQGLLSVIQRYKVKNFIVSVVGNDTEGYKRLIEIIKEKNISVKNLYTGDSFSLGQVKFNVLWPERNWVAQQLSLPLGNLSHLSNLQVLGLQTEGNINDFSYFLHLSYDSFDTIFTGDGDSKIQPEILSRVDLPDVEVLKFPHHGSKTGILSEFLDAIKPKLAVISVGKNSYGHPTKEALDLLNNRAIKIRRTDHDGEVEIVTDGYGWSEFKAGL